uniref:Uncharacterized protein n=1 Tax=Noctiluca scintillans TaxID=2966 RepID=A0A7S1A4K8_NOCSC
MGEFQALGVSTVVCAELRYTQPKDLEQLLAGVDCVYVDMGNTFYLRYQMRVSGFDKLVPSLIDQGVVYVGASAGSVVAGSSIATAFWKGWDPPGYGTEWDLADVGYDGLDLLGKRSVFPHFDTKWSSLVEGRRRELNHALLVLGEDRAWVIDGELEEAIFSGLDEEPDREEPLSPRTHLPATQATTIQASQPSAQSVPSCSTATSSSSTGNVATAPDPCSVGSGVVNSGVSSNLPASGATASGVVSVTTCVSGVSSSSSTSGVNPNGGMSSVTGAPASASSVASCVPCAAGVPTSGLATQFVPSTQIAQTTAPSVSAPPPSEPQTSATSTSSQIPPVGSAASPSTSSPPSASALAVPAASSANVPGSASAPSSAAAPVVTPTSTSANSATQSTATPAAPKQGQPVSTNPQVSPPSSQSSGSRTTPFFPAGYRVSPANACTTPQVSTRPLRARTPPPTQGCSGAQTTPAPGGVLRVPARVTPRRGASPPMTHATPSVTPPAQATVSSSSATPAFPTGSRVPAQAFRLRQTSSWTRRVPSGVSNVTAPVTSTPAGCLSPLFVPTTPSTESQGLGPAPVIVR